MVTKKLNSKNWLRLAPLLGVTVAVLALTPMRATPVSFTEARASAPQDPVVEAFSDRPEWSSKKKPSHPIAVRDGWGNVQVYLSTFKFKDKPSSFFSIEEDVPTGDDYYLTFTLGPTKKNGFPATGTYRGEVAVAQRLTKEIIQDYKKKYKVNLSDDDNFIDQVDDQVFDGLQDLQPSRSDSNKDYTRKKIIVDGPSGPLSKTLTTKSAMETSPNLHNLEGATQITHQTNNDWGEIRIKLLSKDRISGTYRIKARGWSDQGKFSAPLVTPKKDGFTNR